MKKNHSLLYLASQSRSRQQLLQNAGIDFTLINHQSSEVVSLPTEPFSEYVKAIATDKMKNITPLLSGKDRNQKAFVLTADTLISTLITKSILSKPDDVHNAKHMLALLRTEPALVMTAVCIHKYTWQTTWVLEQEQLFHSETEIEFIIPQSDEDWYLDHEPHALNAAGAAVIEHCGLLYLKKINGSFSGVMGLPLYEVNNALTQMGFFK